MRLDDPEYIAVSTIGKCALEPVLENTYIITKTPSLYQTNLRLVCLRFPYTFMAVQANGNNNNIIYVYYKCFLSTIYVD
jgi:hypothetical protein